MNRRQITRITGIIFISSVILSNIPYILLIQNFEYDDILRQPVDYVLTRFHAGGMGLILTWFAFAVTALLLVPATILLHKVIATKDTPYLHVATVLGVVSGILQAIGLMRWVFVVPILADIQVHPSSSESTRAAVAVVFQVLHQYAGVTIGEYLGQTLLVGWTVGVGVVMLRSPLFKSWVGWWGLMTAPLLLLGHSELFATIMPNFPVVEATPIGFILWEIWMLLVGISLLRVPQKRLISLNANQAAFE